MLRIHRLKESLLVTLLFAVLTAVICRLCCLLGAVDRFLAYSHQLDRFWPRLQLLARQLATSCADLRRYENLASTEAIFAGLCGLISDIAFIIQAFARELCIANLCYQLLPLVEGTLSDSSVPCALAHHLLLSVAYWVMLRPDWLDGGIRSLQSAWSSSFESSPPALEPYESATDLTALGAQGDGEYPQHEEDDVDAIEPGAMPGDWLVFDSVYGVIPHETAELWKEQAQQAERKRIEAKSRPLPPVRFSPNNTAP
jgi:hypothetical protein